VESYLAKLIRLAEPDQLGEVALDRVHRHAGHHHRLAGRLAARGERDVEQAVRLAGVVEEQLVEVAHPVEHQRVRMVRLDAQVLLHHRRVGRQRGLEGLAAGRRRDLAVGGGDPGEGVVLAHGRCGARRRRAGRRRPAVLAPKSVAFLDVRVEVRRGRPESGAPAPRGAQAARRPPARTLALPRTGSGPRGGTPA